MVPDRRGAATRGCTRDRPSPTLRPMELAAERIAILKLGAIGDVVNTLPFVCRLRDARPRARILWIIAPLAHALVRGHPAVDEFLRFEVDRPRSWPALARALRRERIELLIDLSRTTKSGLLALASGAPLRLGFDRARAKELNALCTNRRIAPNPSPGTTVEQYLEFADFLGLPPSPPRFDLPHDPWRGAPPRSGAPRVCLNLGASKPANRWEPERFGELAGLLVRELGAEVFLIGGREDRAAAERAASVAGAPLEDQVGRLSLRESAGLIASSALFVGCDTGPLHIAVALGRPVLALFGAADPARTGPFRAPEAVIRNPVPCSPCRRRHCNVPGHPCMSGLEVRAVLERARAHLAAPAPLG